MKLNVLNPLNSLLGKILLALLTSTALALLLVSVIQRSSFKQGFQEFLQRQEEVQLSYLVPELQQWYQQQGSWESLRDNNRQWLRLLARARPEGVRPPEDAPLGPGDEPFARRLRDRDERSRMDDSPAGSATRAHRGDHRPPDDWRRLWRRMYLLDENLERIAGASFEQTDTAALQAVEVGGATVGWVGFVPAMEPASPEARKFLSFQRNTLLASAGMALLAATLLGFLLARHLSRPVVALRDSVQSLTAGDFSTRTEPAGQDEIAALARHINRLAETLQANESTRRRWTADMAHELRTPIAILQAEIEAARDGIRTDWNKTLASLHEEVAHLSLLVDDLQALALADAGALNLKLVDTDLAAVLQQAIDAQQGRLRQAGLQVEVDAPARLLIRADAQRMRQLLLNLLENSCRYTDAGGKVCVTLRAEAGGAKLRVEDTAPGLRPEQMEKLFERFYRAESSRGRAGGGSGLGLSICREIVLAHGGTIRAEASSLGGLAIVAWLPANI
jgi:two-component system sensor histidine kinase BaeS